MATAPDPLAAGEAPGTPPDGPQPGRCGKVLVLTRLQLERQARRAGYLEPDAWQAVLARLAALGSSPSELAELRAGVSQTAAAERWVFPDELAPADPRQCRDLLVGKARAQAGRVPVITHGYLSALLRLAGSWGLAHEVVAQEIAACSAAERWSVDWELACGMEGLLGAEQAAERRRTARQQALAQFERRGQKGWLSQRDLIELYTGLREHGTPDVEARALWEELHAAAHARGWAWSASKPSVWRRLLRAGWRRMLDWLDEPAVFAPSRLLARSGLRVAPPILAVVAVLNAAYPAAAPQPAASSAPAVAVATPIPLPTVTPREAPLPVHPLTLVVSHTDGVGARLRTAPATGPVARLLSEGTAVVEIGSELEINGTGWRQVRAPDGTPGWMAADLLQPADAAPGGTG